MTSLAPTEFRQGNWMQTATGGMFWPLDPRPDEVCIEDIAAALSKMCRYAGHCTRFYSVAEHSVIVSHYVADEYALWGLLHDAAEAYVIDVPRPLKPFLDNYKAIENTVMNAVCEKFGLTPGMPEEVKRVDDAILADEKRHIMVPSPAEWVLPQPPLGLNMIQGWEPRDAEREFLARFNQLTKDIPNG